MFQKLLRIYSYLFAIAASAAYLGLAMVSKISATPLVLDNMPWKGDELSTWLFGLGLLGIVSVAAAATGSRFRILLPIYTAIVFFITVKGNFFSAHSFAGSDDFTRTIGLTASNGVSALASLLQLKSPTQSS